MKIQKKNQTWEPFRKAKLYQSLWLMSGGEDQEEYPTLCNAIEEQVAIGKIHSTKEIEDTLFAMLEPTHPSWIINAKEKKHNQEEEIKKVLDLENI